jgi:putative redox protein
MTSSEKMSSFLVQPLLKTNMKISIQRLAAPYLMEASNEAGHTLLMDSGADGNPAQAMTPMQLLLAGIGGCSTVDIVLILQKQRQNVADIQVQVQGERAKDQTPAVFTDIQLHYTLIGDNLEEEKVRRAIDLSIEKYCSVAKMLEKTANISYSFEIKTA